MLSIDSYLSRSKVKVMVTWSIKSLLMLVKIYCYVKSWYLPGSHFKQYYLMLVNNMTIKSFSGTTILYVKCV